MMLQLRGNAHISRPGVITPTYKSQCALSFLPPTPQPWQGVLGVEEAAARIPAHGIYGPPGMPEWGVGALGSVPQAEGEE